MDTDSSEQPDTEQPRGWSRAVGIALIVAAVLLTTLAWGSVSLKSLLSMLH